MIFLTFLQKQGPFCPLHFLPSPYPTPCSLLPSFCPRWRSHHRNPSFTQTSEDMGALRRCIIPLPTAYFQKNFIGTDSFLGKSHTLTLKCKEHTKGWKLLEGIWPLFRIQEWFVLFPHHHQQKLVLRACFHSFSKYFQNATMCQAWF